MNRNRRLLKLAALAAFLSLPVLAQDAPPDPAAWLRSGPMLGPAEPASATVWLQTRLPVRAQLRFWPQGKPEAARVSDETATTAAGDLIARFRLTGLQFGTRYDYELYLDGFRVERAYPLTFETQPMWRWRGDPPTFRAAVGSCAYINDAPYDRPGDPYGGDYQIFQSIAAAHPDFVVGKRNFSLLEVAGPSGARVLTLRTLDADGKELWKHEIKEAELKVAAKP